MGQAAESAKQGSSGGNGKGDFGATDRFAFSLIGDPCNVAARLESGTKEAGVSTLIGHETAQNCRYVLKSLPDLKVKGKAKALKVYTWA